jgi:hypothetical protein
MSRRRLTLLEASRFSWKAVKIGTTSAQVTASATDKSMAFVSCGSDFCRVRCLAKNPAILDIKSIWFTKRLHPEYMQSPVTAIYQLPHIDDSNTDGRNLGGLLFAVSGEQLLFSRVDSEVGWPTHDIRILDQDDCRAVPRKLLTSARPTCVAYLEDPRKMVIATMEAKEGRSPPHGYRVLHSALRLMNPVDDKSLDETLVKEEAEVPHASKLVSAEFELKHGERVYSIAEWPFTDGRSKKHHLLIVGTGIPNSTGKETGRRLIINTGKQGTKLHLQKESAFDHPVYCTAVYGNETSISAIGKTLAFDLYDSEHGL